MENKKYRYNIDIQDEIVNIYFSYNEEMITFIKALPERKWNPDNKCWSITKEYLDIFQSKFPQLEIPENNTISKDFLEDIKLSIEKYIKQDYNGMSKTYKPSGLHCPRKCVFIRAGIPEGEKVISYANSGCAETGSIRHEYIQNILLRMTNDSNWSYENVADYIENKHKEGKCLDVTVGEQQGVETHLYNNRLHLSFLCDGIVKYKPTGEYYLFEFKNKTSSKAKECDIFPEEHLLQVICYCLNLDLSKVLLLVENRDTCELIIPPLFEVTDEMKKQLEQNLLYYEDCVNKQIVPNKPENINCKFCSYQEICKKYDEENISPFKN